MNASSSAAKAALKGTGLSFQELPERSEIRVFGVALEILVDLSLLLMITVGTLFPTYT